MLRVQGDPEVEMEETWNYLDADSDGQPARALCDRDSAES